MTSSSKGVIDAKNLLLLHKLLADAKAPQTHLAHALGVGVPKISERISLLKEMGLIEKFTVDVNYEKLGYPVIGFLTITLKNKKADDEKVFLDFLNRNPYIIEVHEIFGNNPDFIIKIMCDTPNKLREIGLEISGNDNVEDHYFTYPVARTLKSQRGVDIF